MHYPVILKRNRPFFNFILKWTGSLLWTICITILVTNLQNFWHLPGLDLTLDLDWTLVRPFLLFFLPFGWLTPTGRLCLLSSCSGCGHCIAMPTPMLCLFMLGLQRAAGTQMREWARDYIWGWSQLLHFWRLAMRIRVWDCDLTIGTVDGASWNTSQRNGQWNWLKVGPCPWVDVCDVLLALG